MIDRIYQIYDTDTLNINPSENVIFWNQSSSIGISIPDYIESNSDALKEKYLSLVYNIANNRINNKNLIDILTNKDGFSFWWMNYISEKSPFKCKNIYPVLKIYAILELIKIHDIKFLNLYTADKKLINTLKIISLKNGIKLNIQKNVKKEKSKLNFLNFKYIFLKIPYFSQTILFYFFLLLKNYKYLFYNTKNWDSKNSDVLITSYFINFDQNSLKSNKFESTQWSNIPKLISNNNLNMKWVHIPIISKEIPNTRIALSFLKIFNQCDNYSHIILDSKLNIFNYFQILYEHFKLYFKVKKIYNLNNYFMDHQNNINFYDYFIDDFNFSLIGPIGLQNIIWYKAFDNLLSKINKQKFGLYLFENQGWEMAYNFLWHKYKHGNLIGYQHATVPFWHLYYYNDKRFYKKNNIYNIPQPDTIAVNSNHALEAFKHQGIELSSLCKVEALRYLKYYTNDTTNYINDKKYFITKALILGDMSLQGMTSFFNFFKSEINNINNLNIEFDYKPHPGLFINPENFGISNITTIDSNINDVAYKYSFMISTNSTSASLDAILCKKNVFLYIIPNELNLSPVKNYYEECIIPLRSKLDFINGLELIKNGKLMDINKNKYFYNSSNLQFWGNLIKEQTI